MTKRIVAIILISGLTAPAVFDGLTARGSVGRPMVPAVVAPSKPEVIAKDQKLSEKLRATKKKVKRSIVATLQNSFAILRPVPKKADHHWSQADQFLLNKSTIDQLYDEEMSGKLRDRYNGEVLPHERQALNPTWRATTWEMQRYEQSRKDLANWTVKELGRDQLKDLIKRSKGNSDAIGAIASTTSASYESTPEQKASNEARRASYAHRVDRPVLVEEEEEVIPTKLRAKLNLLKAYGNFTFTNPVVSASVEARAGSGDNLAVQLNRDFKKMELNSKVRYAVDQGLVNFNVNKKITEEISVDLNSDRWTGSKRGSSGEKSKDTAKVVYSVSF